MAQRVLITGYNGFTGHYMKNQLLQSGHEVFGVGATACDDEHYIQADLTDLKSLQLAINEIQPTWVIHLAAKAFVGHGRVDEFYTTNIMGSRNLFEALTQLSKTPEKVLVASSANIYGNTTEGAISESTPANPANDYAISKLAMEYVAKLYADRLPIIIARPFNYTGVGQDEKFLIPKIVSHFKQRKPIIELGNLDVWREFGDVRNVVTAYETLCQSVSAGETTNICSGLSYSLREVISLCEKLTDHKIEIKVNPNFVRAHEVKVLVGDNTHFKSLCPQLSDLTLIDTLQWMLEN